MTPKKTVIRNDDGFLLASHYTQPCEHKHHETLYGAPGNAIPHESVAPFAPFSFLKRRPIDFKLKPIEVKINGVDNSATLRVHPTGTSHLPFISPLLTTPN